MTSGSKIFAEAMADILARDAKVTARRRASALARYGGVGMVGYGAGRIKKGSFSIPAEHIAAGGKAGVKQLRAASRDAESHVWNKVGSKPHKPRLIQGGLKPTGNTLPMAKRDVKVNTKLTPAQQRKRGERQASAGSYVTAGGGGAYLTGRQIRGEGLRHGRNAFNAQEAAEENARRGTQSWARNGKDHKTTRMLMEGAREQHEQSFADARKATSKLKTARRLKVGGAVAAVGGVKLVMHGTNNEIKGMQREAGAKGAAARKANMAKRDSDWKTIGQREQAQVRARRSRKRGENAVIGGTGLVLAGQAKNPRALPDVATGGPLSYKVNRSIGNTKGASLKAAVRTTGRMANISNPHRLAAGGTALALAGAAGMAQGNARHAHQQKKINERRKANAMVRKADQGRYGDYSSKGTRWVSDEDVSKRVRSYDAESDRQRRLGVAEAGLAGGSIAVGRVAHREIREASAGVMSRKPKVPASTENALGRFYGGKATNSKKEIKPGWALTRRGGKLLAASASLGAGAAAVDHYARGSRNRRHL